MAHELIFLLFWVHFVCGQYAPVVNTTQGLVRGLLSEDGDYMYLGIRYGAVDPRNPFGVASPAPAFEGTFDAINDTAMCPQLESGVGVGSLDCLHLSVYVPSSLNNTGPLPVLVFIHGGGWFEGSFTREHFGPKFLIRHGILLVTLNYRLGSYGYMCTDNPRAPGNQANKDQLLALRWVRDNIENFGGDPNKMTLSGNSAGSMSSDLLIINDSPKLFQQAIMQSGVSFIPDIQKPLRDAPFTLAAYFNFQTNDIDQALDFLATVNPLLIIEAERRLDLTFRPCVERSFDGVEAFMTENWAKKEVISTAKDLNILMGFNENEAFGIFLFPDSNLTNVVNDSLELIYATDNDDFYGFETVRQFFFGDDDIDDTKFKEAMDLSSDLMFVYTSIRSIRRYQKSDVGKLFLYLFSYDGGRNYYKNQYNTTLIGAAHVDELGYLYEVGFLDTPTGEDALIVDRMTTMWANFVKYGDPTPQQTDLLPVKWEPITPTSPQHYMHIDSTLRARTSPYNDRMAFWDLFHEINEHLENIVYI